jgi:hypothetical protein
MLLPHHESVSGAGASQNRPDGFAENRCLGAVVDPRDACDDAARVVESHVERPIVPTTMRPAPSRDTRYASSASSWVIVSTKSCER